MSAPGIGLRLSYGLPSGVSWDERQAAVRLAGARERPAVSYRGRVADPLALRELLGAFYDVLLADFRWRPAADREAFRRWLAPRLDREAEGGQLSPERRRFLRYVYDTGPGARPSPVIDPLASVWPDQVAFEGFSRDGSAYARVGLTRDPAAEVVPAVCGTTQLEFSTELYESVRRLRSIFPTELRLGGAAEPPAGSASAGTGPARRLELTPDWLRGFLQLSAAALLPSLRLELEPIHLYDLCRAFRLRRARTSPRALRWELQPGQPVVAVLEPWEERLVLHGSRHDAHEPRIVRTWGRRRLVLIERALAVCERFEVRLLGRGLPYFVLGRGPGVDFTLGLSGWTQADWSATARFEALVARGARGAGASPRPLAWLREHQRGTASEIASALALDSGEVAAALLAGAARGEVVYDALHAVYRTRPLLPDGLPAGWGLGESPEELAAEGLVSSGAAVRIATRLVARGRELLGRVTLGEGRAVEPRLVLDSQGRVVEQACSCFVVHATGGLCAHQRALLRLEDAEL